MKVYIASSLGFCKGVENALNLIYKNTNKHLHLLGDVIHNTYVNDDLKNKGVTIHYEDPFKTINSIDEGIVVFSAHGHDERLEDLLKEKNLPFIDTTCPYIKRNIKNIKEDLKNNIPVIFIGIPGHLESAAILSISNEIKFIDYKYPHYPRIYLKNPHVYTQTTLATDEVNKI